MKKVFSLVCSVCLLSFCLAADYTINNASQALSVSELQQGVLMENAVNIKTPGYRAVKIVSYSDRNSAEKIVRKVNNFSPGPLVLTNRLLDLAIEGLGFFALSDGNGRTYLTRDGRFQVNSDLQVVSVAGGFMLLDESGAPISLANGADMKVDNKGYVYNSDGSVIARIKVVNVTDYNKLRSVNNVVFYLEIEDSELMYASDDFIVRQGNYETSNVDYTKLMVDLADKSQYTANTQMIQTRLKMLDSLNGIVNQN